MRKWSGAILLGAMFAIATEARAVSYDNYASGGSTTFQSLGFLSGGSNSGALGLSQDGRYVTGYSTSIPGTQAFSLQINYPGTLGGPVSFQSITGLGFLDNAQPFSQGQGASNNGKVVGLSDSSSPSGRGFIIDASASGRQALPPFSVSLPQSNGFFINGPGNRAVGQTRIQASPVKTSAAFWNVDNAGVATGPIILPNYAALPGTTGYNAGARGVTTDGSVAVGFGVDVVSGVNRTRPTYWAIDGAGTPGPAQSLPFLPSGTNGQARSVTENGSALGVNPDFIAVGNSLSLAPDNTTVSQAAAWTLNSGSITTRALGFLGTSPGQYSSVANGISSSKGYLTTVVGRSVSGLDPQTMLPIEEAFTMVLGDNSATAMKNLKTRLNDPDINLQIPAGWRLVEATAVSADGNTIVGYGLNPDGQTEAWVVVLATPEPGTLGLLVIGALTLSRRRARVC